MARLLFRRRTNAIRYSTGETVFDGLNVLLMLVISFLFLYPFWYILVYAFNNSQDAQAGNLWFWPRKLTLNNFIYVLSGTLLKRAYLVTIARAVSGSVLHLTVTGLAAYALSKRRIPGRKLLTYFLIIPMFIGGTMISIYVVMAKLGLLKFSSPAWRQLPCDLAFFEGDPRASRNGEDGRGGYIRPSAVLPLCTPIIAPSHLLRGGHWLTSTRTWST
jgi:hypothetical protein